MVHPVSMIYLFSVEIIIRTTLIKMNLKVFEYLNILQNLGIKLESRHYGHFPTVPFKRGKVFKPTVT